MVLEVGCQMQIFFINTEQFPRISHSFSDYFCCVGSGKQVFFRFCFLVFNFFLRERDFSSSGFFVGTG